MYLKSIEIHGFKSFANKILFEFHDGITGIVGPNGSGKSNVGDAVRWVLGEQSAKQLRGSKMEDVIFSGTEARKPMGFAYVAITLDNSDHKLPIDYDEVTVARRVYRSGESEYLINGSTCRLRDVQELFLDTGIGREGYSIIGQGQVEKILSGKPEDRRELFDEAAGIVKFKKRKATAEKNLESEHQNLCRINDILTEIEKQIGPLEKQSLVAKEYLKLRDELKVLDVNMFLLEYDHIHTVQKELEEKLTIASADYNQTNISYEKTKEEYEVLEQKLEEFDSKIDVCRNNVNENKLDKEKLEGDYKVLKEQIIAANQNDEHYKIRMDAVLKEIGLKKEELTAFEAKKQEIEVKIKELQLSQEAVTLELSKCQDKIKDYLQCVERCNSDIFENLSENTTIKTNLQRYETILEQNNIKKVELNQKLLKNKSDEASIEGEIQTCHEKLEEISKEILNIQKINEEIELEASDVQKGINQATEELSNSQQDYHRQKSKLDSLKNITERYEGYGNSIRRIMEQKDKYPGILGVVADIIKVDKKYETAVETALGGSIQNVVTDTENTAKLLIEYLKANKYGRATFLPLTGISKKTSSHNPQVFKEQGVIGVASTLITAADKYAHVIEYLLGRILVVDNIDNAIQLNRKYQQSLRIVTIDGELLNPGGSMSGGAYKNSSNLLSRRREIEDIEAIVKKLEEKLTSLQKEIASLKENRLNYRTIVEENKATIQNLYLAQNTAKLNLNQANSKKENSQKSFNEIRQESSLIDNQTRELKENIEKLNVSLQENIDKSKEKEKGIEGYNRLLEEERNREKEITENIGALRLDFSNLEQNSQYSIENVRRVKGDIRKFEEEIENIKDNIHSAVEQIEEKQKAMEMIKERMEEYSKNIEIFTSNLNELSKDREVLSMSHKNILNKREELSKLMNDLDKEIFRLNNQKEKLKEQMDAQITYMWEQYELTYNTACAIRSEGLIHSSDMKKAISALKASIKNLGDVNVNAIDDFKQLSDRYDLLKNQRDDLVKAEEVLRDIIEELDIEMRKQFEEKFKQIQTQFDIVFKELFGGGKGALELMEDDDILEAGIRIIAQPPGKKLQNMMQLSGGEKALTAISLLFAIQNLKPSPFCLLDEIEAALDDSNVSRYAKYLHKLTKDTQFIIITHRRGTMAAADTLYGITMQEKGVSTLVSVNLIENELDK